MSLEQKFVFERRKGVFEQSNDICMCSSPNSTLDVYYFQGLSEGRVQRNVASFSRR